MTTNCAPACQTCHELDFTARCPTNATDPTALNPGDLAQLFQRLVHDFSQYEPVVHMMPEPPMGGIPKGPWVVTLEKFLTTNECEQLIQLGAQQGYKMSKDVGQKQYDGSFKLQASDGRTSANAWCTGECYNDIVSQQVARKIETITGIPEQNYEYLQLLRYEEGQFYQVHHDFIPHHATERYFGARVLTVFLYLNDVEQGGGTNFPGLNLTFEPKQGRALIWPSVWNTFPNAKDGRTRHEALPVEKGVKYAANAWLHQRNYKETYKRGCA